jgi:hypothetical protein
MPKTIFVIAACRRIINADCIGWRRHRDKTDFRLVLAFYDEMRVTPTA